MIPILSAGSSMLLPFIRDLRLEGVVCVIPEQLSGLTASILKTTGVFIGNYECNSGGTGLLLLLIQYTASPLKSFSDLRKVSSFANERGMLS